MITKSLEAMALHPQVKVFEIEDFRMREVSPGGTRNLLKIKPMEYL
jgi:hypothetical protein